MPFPKKGEYFENFIDDLSEASNIKNTRLLYRNISQLKGNRITDEKLITQMSTFRQQRVPTLEKFIDALSHLQCKKESGKNKVPATYSNVQMKPNECCTNLLC